MTPPDPAAEPSPLMPVRRLHNFLYCPRLFYYQWVENLFVENEDTVEGSTTHRNVDKPSHFTDEMDLAERSSVRSLHLSSDHLGLTGKIDVLEDMGEGRELIDYKKGSPARDQTGAWAPKENDTFQIAAYALLLREAGIPVAKASIYYAEIRKRIPVQLDDALYEECLRVLDTARAIAESGKCPPPLVNDHRCLHCSAYSICLPGESKTWAEGDTPDRELSPPRPPKSEGEYLVVQDPKTRVGIRGQRVRVSKAKEVLTEIPLAQLSALSLLGPVQVSAQTIHALLENQIPVGWFSPAGKYLGNLQGLPTSGVDARRGQYRMYDLPESRKLLAAETIRCKIHNQRVMLMRNGGAEESDIKQLARLRDQTRLCKNLEDIRGVEGAAAQLYFKAFASMLKTEAGGQFDFNGRNRRPPKDPVNALLSLAYSILCKEITGLLHMVGLDPFLGFFHAPRYGRPALALDLMEEFRPLIADSVVISLINRREITENDFVLTGHGVNLKSSGHRQFWPAWYRRMNQEVTHPQFKYRMSYRRMLEVQCRQLWRYMRGETKTYTGFTTR